MIEEDPDAVPKLSVYKRILCKAADAVGGERALARYLKVPLPDIYAWVRPGAEPPPMAIFLKAVDLVLHDLDMPDEQRAQSIRVAVIHEDQRRAAVMQRLHELSLGKHVSNEAQRRDRKKRNRERCAAQQFVEAVPATRKNDL